MEAHKAQLEKLEAAVKSASDPLAQEAAYSALLNKYPLLYGYWLKYLQGLHPSDRLIWKQALEKCPTLELHTAYFEAFKADAEEFRASLEIVGHYFQAAPIWDKYLESCPENTKEIISEVITIPLYDYAKYYAKANEVLQDDSLTQKGSDMSKNIAERWAFESKITRPYFHVVPLERADLENWTNYLNLQEQSSDKLTTIALYRRCLTACALYPSFWMRYIRWVGANEPSLLQTVYQQAILYVDKQHINSLTILYASYLEINGQADQARAALEKMDKSALNDFLYRNGQQPQSVSLEEAHRLWNDRKIDKYKYLQILRDNGDLENYFKMDIAFNGPPDAAKIIKKQQQAK